MRYIILLMLSVLLQFSLQAQQTPDDLIKEGVALHEKGDYEGAIAKYDAALALDASNVNALYEKSYSLAAMKKYAEAEDLLKQVLKIAKDPETRRLGYVTYGSLLDEDGQPKKALKAYEEGLKEFPDSYLLYFNKGVTEAGMNQPDDAIKSFKQALLNNPYHASSHNALGRLVASQSRIASILSIFTFLVIEPEGARAEENLAFLNKLLMKGVNRKDDKNVTISIDADLLNKKNKPKEDDFTSADFMMSLLAANDKVPDSLGLKTDADKLSYHLQMLINVIAQEDKKDKGFFKNFYVPMFMEMKKNDLVTIASYVALSSTGKEDINEWLKKNKDDVDGFYRWFENYKWEKH